MTIKQRRLEKGWSQLELAEYTGLSLRTIQRVEKGQKPSTETIKALAAVFEIDRSEVNSDPMDKPIDTAKLSAEEMDELTSIRELREFLKEAVIFVVIAPFLILMHVLGVYNGDWVLWAILGWAIYLIWSGFDVFDARDFLGKRWERRLLEKRIGRKLD